MLLGLELKSASSASSLIHTVAAGSPAFFLTLATPLIRAPPPPPPRNGGIAAVHRSRVKRCVGFSGASVLGLGLTSVSLA